MKVELRILGIFAPKSLLSLSDGSRDSRKLVVQVKIIENGSLISSVKSIATYYSHAIKYYIHHIRKKLPLFNFLYLLTSMRSLKNFREGWPVRSSLLLFFFLWGGSPPAYHPMLYSWSLIGVHCFLFTLCRASYLWVKLQSGEWFHCFNLIACLICKNGLKLTGTQLRWHLTAHVPLCEHIRAQNQGSSHKW